MKQELTAKNEAQSAKINRAAFVLHMVLVVFQLVAGNYEWAVVNMGIALVFDPFSSAKWPPLIEVFQRITSIFHET